MTGPIAVIVRHGAYHQRPDTPSALQPFPLTEEGKLQAKECGEQLADLIAEQGLELSPQVYSSCQLRAWQTARLACDVLGKRGHRLEIIQTPDLAERSVGSAANLTLAEIEQILIDDPRYSPPPKGWKSDSDYCLPLDGAESLMTAGRRVANHLRQTIKDKQPHSITLHFGHGASFRHAAHLLGILTREKINRFSMFHALPLQLCHNTDGTWTHVGGDWKIRKATDKPLD